MRLTKSTIFEFQASDVSRALVLHVDLGRESSSWDEMGMCRNNVKPELELNSRTSTQSCTRSPI